MGTGDVGLSATAFPSFQGPWAGLDVPGDIWMATTAPALPTRTQHAVSTARLHPSFLPSGVSRTIEPRQAGRPVAGRPARGGPKRHPRLGGPPGQRHAVLDMRAQQVPAALRVAACARSASPAPAARARAAGSSTAGEPTSSRAQVVATRSATSPATPAMPTPGPPTSTDAPPGAATTIRTPSASSPAPGSSSSGTAGKTGSPTTRPNTGHSKPSTEILRRRLDTGLLTAGPSARRATGRAGRGWRAAHRPARDRSPADCLRARLGQPRVPPAGRAARRRSR